MRRTPARGYRFFISTAEAGLDRVKSAAASLRLLSELISWSVILLVRPGGVRRGAFLRNTLDYGLGALPILGIICFLIGFITALQSAAQLRLVGANIFVADLLAVGTLAEMGPLMTAVLVTGRSGSSIASEIATMKYTEELDALRTMGLDPVRFVMVPKLWALLVSMPVLTLFANAMGIMGGTLIAVTYLDLSFDAFWNELVKAMMIKDLMSGMVKSVVYGVIITTVACRMGLTFSGGADGVGRATTKSVVASLFAIIAADSALGLLFYF